MSEKQFTLSSDTPGVLHRAWHKRGEPQDFRKEMMVVLGELGQNLPPARRKEMRQMVYPIACLKYPVEDKDIQRLMTRKAVEAKERLASLIGEENIPEWLFDPEQETEPVSTPERPQKQKVKESDGIIDLTETPEPTEEQLAEGISDKDVYWVYHRIQDASVLPEHAPSPGAWGLMRFARANPTEFYKNHVAKALAKKPPEEDDANALRNEADFDRLIECLVKSREEVRAEMKRLDSD